MTLCYSILKTTHAVLFYIIKEILNNRITSLSAHKIKIADECNK